MKTFFTCLIGLALAATITTQAQTLTKDLPEFNKIVSSPLIDVILIKGEKESVRIEYHNVTPDKINVVTKGKTLRLYLTDAQITDSKKEGNWKEATYWRRLYPGAHLRAYVTYRQLNYVEMRGQQDLTCNDTLVAQKLKLKLYGENRVELAGLKARKLKVSLFGENRVDIYSGTAKAQKYNAFGENKVHAEKLLGETVKTSLFGETLMDLYASERIRMTAFGESTVVNNGTGSLRKWITLGDNTLKRK
ncbi:DUF2807 domain-containing protein [Cytophagaceae bacterium DM2B3-1]|uniref:DUF2807 domain-containing protein n=1 Tax=Xanthocytophaga flava TaxID=3048013 RepID=A0ABT7CDI8_9BACT|nr:DUF2807 domain-containing protein [Xanthocytophaga flavus]MDJ1491794.1 DUF2807 domain-containing protein [Xanthocytophaga flavus]